jgi:hypothetical protein
LGPTALPGEYTIKLTANGRALAAPLTVKLDPRVKATPLALQQKFALETRLASALSSSSEAVLQAESVRDQIKKVSTQASVGDSLKALDAKLAALLDGPEKPQPASPRGLKDVNGEIFSLNGATSGNDSVSKDADAAPTTALVAATSTVEKDLSPILKTWEAIKTTDIAAMNQQLKSANLPQLKPELNPDAEEAAVNQE